MPSSTFSCRLRSRNQSAVKRRLLVRILIARQGGDVGEVAAGRRDVVRCVQRRRVSCVEEQQSIAEKERQRRGPSRGFLLLATPANLPSARLESGMADFHVKVRTSR